MTDDRKPTDEQGRPLTPDPPEPPNSGARVSGSPPAGAPEPAELAGSGGPTQSGGPDPFDEDVSHDAGAPEPPD